MLLRSMLEGSLNPSLNKRLVLVIVN